ncbi:hypothetical protein EPN16_07150 [bacterium]|nr:MAG: hypothetical protein EPN16_07150 [bacterium]
MNWLSGMVSIAGVVYAFRFRKLSFVRFLLTVFCAIFIILSFMKPLGYLHLDEFWWASPIYTAAIILASNLLADLGNKYKRFRYVLITFFIYLFSNAWNFINFPENCFVPRKGIIAEHLCERAGFYLSGGNSAKAEKLYKIIARINASK